MNSLFDYDSDSSVISVTNNITSNTNTVVTIDRKDPSNVLSSEQENNSSMDMMTLPDDENDSNKKTINDHNIAINPAYNIENFIDPELSSTKNQYSSDLSYYQKLSFEPIDHSERFFEFKAMLAENNNINNKIQSIDSSDIHLQFSVRNLDHPYVTSNSIDFLTVAIGISNSIDNGNKAECVIAEYGDLFEPPLGGLFLCATRYFVAEPPVTIADETIILNFLIMPANGNESEYFSIKSIESKEFLKREYDCKYKLKKDKENPTSFYGYTSYLEDIKKTRWIRNNPNAIHKQKLVDETGSIPPDNNDADNRNNIPVVPLATTSTNLIDNKLPIAIAHAITGNSNNNSINNNNRTELSDSNQHQDNEDSNNNDDDNNDNNDNNIRINNNNDNNKINNGDNSNKINKVIILLDNNEGDNDSDDHLDDNKRMGNKKGKARKPKEVVVPAETLLRRSRSIRNDSEQPSIKSTLNYNKELELTKQREAEKTIEIRKRRQENKRLRDEAEEAKRIAEEEEEETKRLAKEAEDEAQAEAEEKERDRLDKIEKKKEKKKRDLEAKEESRRQKDEDKQRKERETNSMEESSSKQQAQSSSVTAPENTILLVNAMSKMGSMFEKGFEALSDKITKSATTNVIGETSSIILPDNCNKVDIIKTSCTKKEDEVDNKRKRKRSPSSSSASSSPEKKKKKSKEVKDKKKKKKKKDKKKKVDSSPSSKSSSSDSSSSSDGSSPSRKKNSQKEGSKNYKVKMRFG